MLPSAPLALAARLAAAMAYVTGDREHCSPYTAHRSHVLESAPLLASPADPPPGAIPPSWNSAGLHSRFHTVICHCATRLPACRPLRRKYAHSWSGSYELN